MHTRPYVDTFIIIFSFIYEAFYFFYESLSCVWLFRNTPPNDATRGETFSIGRESRAPRVFRRSARTKRETNDDQMPSQRGLSTPSPNPRGLWPLMKRSRHTRLKWRGIAYEFFNKRGQGEGIIYYGLERHFFITYHE